MDDLRPGEAQIVQLRLLGYQLRQQRDLVVQKVDQRGLTFVAEKLVVCDFEAFLLGHKGPQIRVFLRKHNIHELLVGEHAVLIEVVMRDQLPQLVLGGLNGVLGEEGV